MPSNFDINQHIAKKFFARAELLESKGEKYKFRAISYIKAARVIELLDKGLDEIYKHGWLTGLQKIKGVGNRLAHEIENELKKLKLNIKK